MCSLSQESNHIAQGNEDKGVKISSGECALAMLSGLMERVIVLLAGNLFILFKLMGG